MAIIKLLFLSICLLWNEGMAYAERTTEIPTMRVQIKPIAPTIADYRKLHEQRAAELLGTERPRPPISPNHLKAFEEAVASENALLAEICLGLKQKLSQYSIIGVEEENLPIVLEVKITDWGTYSSIPIPEPDPPASVVTVTCKKDDRELFTTAFQRSSWGSTKKPHAIGVSLGKKTAKKLLELR